MKLLANLRLRTKLLLLLGLSLLSLVVSTGIVTSVMYHRMLDDRVDKLRAVVDSTRQLALGLENQVGAHQLTRAQALERLQADIHAIRFDNGTGYLTLIGDDGTVVAHGIDPSREGKPSAATDARVVPCPILSAPRCAMPTPVSSPTIFRSRVRRSRNRRFPTWRGLRRCRPRSWPVPTLMI